MKKGKLYFKQEDKKKYVILEDGKTEISLPKDFINEKLQPNVKHDIEYEELSEAGKVKIISILYNGKIYPEDKKQNIDPARAPYNFVPLNETVIEAQPLPDFDKFYDTDDRLKTEGKKRYSGYMDLSIETKTPLFIRAEKENFFSIDDKPIIPGSSLRGMVRTLVEIASFSKFAIYNNKTLYRRSSLTVDNDKVFAGYLFKDEESYKIHPANYQQINRREEKQKINKPHIYKRVNGSTYFSVGEFNHRYIIWKFTKKQDVPLDVDPAVIESYANDDQRDDDVIDLIKSASNSSIRNKQDKIIEGNNSSFDIGIPVFYRTNGLNDVISIGHAKYHRIPYKHDIEAFVKPRQHQEKKFDFAQAIFGFLIEKKKYNQQRDSRIEFASRIFFEDATINAKNWNYDNPASIPQILASPKPTSYQLYLKQLSWKDKAQKTWDKNDGQIRGNKLYWHKPKPKWKEEEISFSKQQFYKFLKENNLNEDSFKGIIREENQKKIIDLIKLPNELWPSILKAVGKYETQHTTIQPVKEEITFSSRIRFENLTTEELGCLLFVLDLHKGYCHKLGMGKPLGLGSVEIKPTLTISDRQARYKKLFEKDNWNQPVIEEKEKEYFKAAFEKYILSRLPAKEKKKAKSLWEVCRLQQLKNMLRFEQDEVKGDDWLERTRYMEIEHPNPKASQPGQKEKINEYINRPVLPEPDEVIDKNTYK